MTKWISVNFSVPSDAREVLVCSCFSYKEENGEISKTMYIEIGQRKIFKNGHIKWISNKGGFIQMHNDPHTKVTHWMPLPEPPEKEE